MQRETRIGKQRGVTAIGWVFWLAPVFLVVYMAVRLVPVYNNYLGLVRALDGFVKDQAGNTSLTKAQIGDLLSRRFVTEYVEKPSVSEIDIRREGGGWELTAEYEEVVPLFFNISLLVEFNKSVKLE
ncbi:MAG: DUF4845 domain-containing protein [Steroidobacteraceae bacterium]|nr:DUF4845 domain-containing protein [Steroidobacteraceae bacterium]MDW8258116.1 DUF4845 domain-containing protein [Gammaproteobacteria bacterium]